MAKKKQKKQRAQSYSLQTVKEVYSYWGKSPLVYRLSSSFFIFDNYLRKKAVEALELKKGDVVLDLGCGPGIMLKKLQEKVGPEGKIIGVDYVDEMITQCKKLVARKKWENVELIRQDAAKLKLKPGSVDAIISIIGLSAMPEHKKALRGCYSALKRGGRLVVLDGKDFGKGFAFLNPLLKVLRWSKSYERKDIIGEMKKIFGNAQSREYLLGSTFIAVSAKR
ncbi:methyltransferase domain-containing protein [Candidatus Woesearchaeota archaeon]|nr:methyltransferase domain-containing protein [Candidatus Woesearchaeota archaeon]